MTPVIRTPRGSVSSGKDGKASLTWSTGFSQKWSEQFSDAQKFVDSEVLRYCEPYTPLRTGMLVKSGSLGTFIGSGEVAWIAPYARVQYYLKNRRPSQTGPLRGSYWFKRMKEVHGDKIIEGAKKIAGKGRK